jgi:hypothetical protein
MPGPAFVSFLFFIKDNPLKYIEIAMGEREMAPLFHFMEADPKG